ncbi:MAG: hypothetical protein V4510_09820 [bacterium]
MMTPPHRRKESPTLDPETILIRARVVYKDGKAYTVRLDDGFGNAEAIVHSDAAIPDPRGLVPCRQL